MDSRHTAVYTSQFKETASKAVHILVFNAGRAVSICQFI